MSHVHARREARHRRRRHGRGLRGWLLGVMIMTGAASAHDELVVDMHYDAQAGRLSLHAHAVYLSDVLPVLSRLTGIDVVVHTDVEDDSAVNVEFDDIALEEALARILNGKGYALDREGAEISRLWVLSDRANAGSAGRGAEVAVAGREVTPTTERTAPLFRARIPGFNDEHRAQILEALAAYEARTGKDPRKQLDDLRRMVVPGAISLRSLSDAELPDAIIEMVADDAVSFERRSAQALADTAVYLINGGPPDPGGN